MKGRALNTRQTTPLNTRDDLFWAKLFFRVTGFFFRLFWRWKILITYLVLTGLFVSHGWLWATIWLIATVLIPIVIKALDKANIALPDIAYKAQEFLSIGWTHDWKKQRTAKEEARAVEAGHELLRQVGILAYDDEGIYDVALVEEADYDILVLGQMAVSPLQIHKLLSEYLSVLGYVSITLLAPENGYQTIKLLKTDPLDVSWEIKSVDDVEIDFKKATFASALNEDGEVEAISFENISGMLVGGMSGSGKSLSIMAGLFPYLYKGAEQGKTELYLADGKGGFDWQFAEGLSTNKNPADVELDEMVELTNQLVEIMDTRYEMLKNLEVTNGWTLPREQMPHLVFLIDECQNYFDSTGLNKEDKGKVQEIVGNITRLVKKARAVAMTVVLMTQKSDATAIPTVIRDICQLRISLRQPSKLNSTLILGEIPEDLPITPEQLPAGKPGMAIMMNEKSEYVKVRFGYVTDETLKKWSQQAKNLKEVAA